MIVMHDAQKSNREYSKKTQCEEEVFMHSLIMEMK